MDFFSPSLRLPSRRDESDEARWREEQQNKYCAQQSSVFINKQRNIETGIFVIFAF
jgi:hypothetical protein